MKLRDCWLIEDPETGLVDGFYYDRSMAWDAYEVWSDRLGYPMDLKVVREMRNIYIPDSATLTDWYFFDGGMEKCKAVMEAREDYDAV